MMKYCFLFLPLFLTACASKAPSDAIIENTRKEVAAVQEVVKRIEKQTPAECKTDVFLANLEAINRQVSSIGGQLESIGLSCQTEKKAMREIYEQKVLKRNVIIGVLLLIIAIILLYIKKGKLL